MNFIPFNHPAGSVPWDAVDPTDGTLVCRPMFGPAAAAAARPFAAVGPAVVTIDQLLSIMPRAGTVATPFPLAAMLTALNAAMARYGIAANRKRQAAFLAQVAVESAQLTALEEQTTAAYQTKHYEHNKNLGNTQSGDGVRYRGRGPLQLTGRDNYARCGTYLRRHGYADAHLADDPDQVATDLTVACQTAGWYWAKSRGHDASHRADQLRMTTDGAERARFDAISTFVNGGSNGADARWQFYRRAVATFAGGH